MSDNLGLPEDSENWTVKDFKKSRRILRRMDRKAQKISDEILSMIGTDHIFEIEKLKEQLAKNLESERRIGEMLHDVTIEIEDRLIEGIKCQRPVVDMAEPVKSVSG